MLTTLNILPVSAELEEMPKDVDSKTALNKLLVSDDFEFFTIGDTTEAITNNDVKFTRKSDLDDIELNKKYNSIWINKDKHSELLTSKGVEKIEKLLNNGCSVYFIGLEDVNILTKLFTTSTSYETTKDSDTKQIAGFITKNKKGEVFIGHFISKESIGNENVSNSLLVSAWNRRNDFNYTKKGAMSSFISSLTQKVSAAGDFFTIGSQWRIVFGWQNYVFNTSYGDMSEWKSAYYLTDSIDGKDYWAMALQAGMAPYPGSGDYLHFSKTLNYFSDADSNGQANKLWSDYQPKTKPSSSTWEFSLGASLSQSKIEPTIGASWSITANDLSFYDYSQLGSQKMDLKWNYTTWRTYSNNTSWQNCSFIYQAPTGATNCKIDNGRLVKFCESAYPFVETDSQYSMTYVTIVNKQ